VALGGEHQHRHLGQAVGQRPDAAADLQAVRVGQHQVEDHQVRRALLQHLESTRTVGGVRESETRLREVFTHHLRQAGVVFDHQELGRAHGSIVSLVVGFDTGARPRHRDMEASGGAAKRA